MFNETIHGTLTEDAKRGQLLRVNDDDTFSPVGSAPEPKATIEQDGKVYEWVRHGVTGDGDYVISHATGHMVKRGGESLAEYNIFRLMLEVPVCHTFGGVTYEETGWVRDEGKEQYYLLNDRVMTAQIGQSTSPISPMLRPVSVEL